MFKIALCQMAGSKIKTTQEHKEECWAKATKMIADAAEGGADIVVLPEIWNGPYSNKAFPAFSEPAGGPSWQLMSDLAKKHHIYLVGGSIPENVDGKVYNTCFVFDRDGNQIARHRKTHLFDIDVKGGQSFKESDVLSPGEGATVFETEFGKIGVIICFDIRFADFTRKEAIDMGAKLVCMPAAFNMTTGPAHWDLTIRARALDNQIYFAACAPARNTESSYVSYANSAVAGPWGDFKAHAGADEEIVFCDIDFDYVDDCRSQIPIVYNRRPELY